MLKGNKFVITLRFVLSFPSTASTRADVYAKRRDVQTPTPTAISLSLTTLRNRGFINYYGMQRFGTSPIPTHAIGLALLQSNWALAAYMILRPRDGEGGDIATARMLWLVGGDAQEAARVMPRRCVAERASASPCLFLSRSLRFAFASEPYCTDDCAVVLEHYHRSGDATDHLSAITRVRPSLPSPPSSTHPHASVSRSQRIFE